MVARFVRRFAQPVQDKQANKHRSEQYDEDNQ